jgi:hypothetical protein
VKNVIALLLLAVASGGQRPTATRSFAWNWQNAQELTVAGQALSTSRDISPSDRTRLLEALVEQFKGESKPRERAARARVKPLDLNGDGVPEIVCQASDDQMCSPTGNCSFWIFGRDSGGYRLLLKKAAIQTFTIQRNRTDGYFDVVLGMHRSATEQELFLYRFHDGRYGRTACYDAKWTYLGKDGESHDPKEPRITPCPR